MQADHIRLKYFRNIESLELDFDPHVNIFYGQNAQGKTNLLEAVFFCATGRSHRTSYDKECIMHDRDEALIHLDLTRKRQDQIEIHLRRAGRKQAALNKTPVRKIEDLFGSLQVVMFSPEDLSLIKNGPAERRRFMDLEICQTDPVYLHTLKSYHKVLRQRNQLLKNLDAYRYSYDDQLLPWDQQLVDFGLRLIRLREEFIRKLSEHTAHVHESLSHGTEALSLIYEKNMEADEDQFFSKLRSTAQRDILLGSTHTGPHRDDIAMRITAAGSTQDVRVYGSQGQQRTTALSMKLAELELMEEEIGTPPILLLDDVMSELDSSRQNDLIRSMQEIQTIITCTGLEDLIRHRMNIDHMFYVENGYITQK